MDIIFQSGDFYNATSSIWSNLIIIISALLGALISGFIAIWIFMKGLRIEKEKKKDEYISERIDLEEYFFNNIDSISSFIDRQVDEISKCSKRVEDWNNKDFTLSVFPELTAKDAWAINQERIFKIFVTNREGTPKEKSSDFVNVRNCFYYIDDFKTSQNELNKEVSQRLYENIKLWNDSLNKLTKLSNEFVCAYNSKPIEENDQFLKFYTDLMVNKQSQLIKENKSQNMSIVFNELIEPLKQYMKDNPNSMDKRILAINEPLLNLQNAYIQIISLRYERRKKALESGRRLLAVKRILQDCISSTKERKKIYL